MSIIQKFFITPVGTAHCDKVKISYSSSNSVMTVATLKVKGIMAKPSPSQTDFLQKTRLTGAEDIAQCPEAWA